jgi:hypothetical protein
MYTQITDSYFDVYDGETGAYMGNSKFTLPQNSEDKLLDLLNYNKVPDSLVLLNVNLSETTQNYIPPELFRKNKRQATLYLDVIDTNSDQIYPFQIHMRYDVVARGRLSGSRYFFDSLGLDNIQIEEVDLRYS